MCRIEAPRRRRAVLSLQHGPRKGRQVQVWSCTNKTRSTIVSLTPYRSFRDFRDAERVMRVHFGVISSVGTLWSAGLADTAEVSLVGCCCSVGSRPVRQGIYAYLRAFESEFHDQTCRWSPNQDCLLPDTALLFYTCTEGGLVIVTARARANPACI